MAENHVIQEANVKYIKSKLKTFLDFLVKNNLEESAIIIVGGHCWVSSISDLTQSIDLPKTDKLLTTTEDLLEAINKVSDDSRFLILSNTFTSVSVKNVELSIDTSEDTNTLFSTIKFV